MEEEYYSEMIPYVSIGEKWVPCEETEHLNIEEDFYGYDLVTFRYQGKTYKSRIITKPRE